MRYVYMVETWDEETETWVNELMFGTKERAERFIEKQQKDGSINGVRVNIRAYMVN